MRACYLLVLSFIVVGFAACSADEVPVTSTNAPNLNRVLTVTISHIYDQQYRQDSLVSGATVVLYKTREDRADNAAALATSVTDTSGKVRFNYMEYETYYLQVTHANLGKLNRQFTFPNGALNTFEYYDYY